MSKTHHGSAEIVVSDSNDVEYSLHCRYSISGGCASYYDRNYGWQPEDPAELEISEVLCVSIAFHHGKKTILPITGEKFRSDIGTFCLECFEDEINEKIFEQATEACQDEYDPSDERI